MKKLVSFLLCCAFIVAFPLNALAAESISTAHDINVELLSMSSVKGDLFKNSSDLKSQKTLNDEVGYSPELSKLNILNEGDNVQLSFNLKNIKEETMVFTGQIYPIDGGVAYDDKLLLGDFSSKDNYNLALFRIKTDVSSDKESIISLLLEDTSDGRIYKFEIGISNDIFSEINQYSEYVYENIEFKDRYEKKNFDKKIVDLLRYDEEWVNTINKSTLKYNPTFSHDYYNTGVAATKTTLQNFFNGMNTYGYLNLSSNTAMQNVLSQSSWKFYKNNGTLPYFYEMYGDTYGSDNYVWITFCSETVGHSTNTASSKTTVFGSLCLEYNLNSKYAYVIYYDMGLQLQNFQQVVGKLGGTNTCFQYTLCII